MAGKLTAKQEQFCKEYLIDLNATAAARRAGYKDPNFGRQMLTKTNVAARLEQLMGARSKRTQITADKVLAELALIGFSNMKHYAKWSGEGAYFYDSDELSDDESAVIAEVSSRKTVRRGKKDEDETETVEVKLKLHDKRAALVDIGRHLGMFTDRLEHSGGQDITITRRIIGADEP